MVGGISNAASISGITGYYGYYPNYMKTGRVQNNAPVQQAQEAEKAQETQKAPGVVTMRRGADPETPVQPVNPAPVVRTGVSNSIPFLRQGADPVEMAVRMRIQYPEDAQPGAKAGVEAGAGVKAGAAAGAEVNVGTATGTGVNAGAETKAGAEAGAKAGVDAVQEAAEEGRCETCEQRKYQDGSDDPGVSFKTPSHIAPEQAASAVRGHEMEHVVRESAKAAREDRKVVSQSVSIHTDICPECGKVYVSGGTTRTTTAAKSQPYADIYEPEERRQFSAVA